MKTNQLWSSGIRFLGALTFAILLGAGCGKAYDNSKLLVNVDETLVCQVNTQNIAMDLNAVMPEQNISIKTNQVEQIPLKRTVISTDLETVETVMPYVAKRRQCPVVTNPNTFRPPRGDDIGDNTS